MLGYLGLKTSHLERFHGLLVKHFESKTHGYLSHPGPNLKKPSNKKITRPGGHRVVWLCRSWWRSRFQARWWSGTTSSVKTSGRGFLPRPGGFGVFGGFRPTAKFPQAENETWHKTCSASNWDRCIPAKTHGLTGSEIHWLHLAHGLLHHKSGLMLKSICSETNNPIKKKKLPSRYLFGSWHSTSECPIWDQISIMISILLRIYL